MNIMREGNASAAALVVLAVLGISVSPCAEAAFVKMSGTVDWVEGVVPDVSVGTLWSLTLDLSSSEAEIGRNDSYEWARYGQLRGEYTVGNVVATEVAMGAQLMRFHDGLVDSLVISTLTNSPSLSIDFSRHPGGLFGNLNLVNALELIAPRFDQFTPDFAYHPQEYEYAFVLGRVTNLEITPVPIPASAWLLLSGLVLAMRRRRTHRKSSIRNGSITSSSARINTLLQNARRRSMIVR